MTRATDPGVSGAELVLHPVRMRIVEAFLGGATLTTAQLRAQLSEVPVASVYRHVARLAAAGVLEVVEEHRVRGRTERTYALREDGAVVAASEAAAMSAAEHRRGFAVFMTGLMSGFDRYLGAGGPPGEDVVGYRRAALWLTDEELAALVEDLRRAIAPYRDARPRPGRRRHHLATVLFPDPAPDNDERGLDPDGVVSSDENARRAARRHRAHE